MAAAHLERPVIDSDMMGRAYPEAQMTSVAVGDLVPCPLTTVDVRGLESVVDKVPTWKWMERVSRKICVEYGSTASTCKAPRTGAEVKKWGIHGTTTKAIAIGRAVRAAQRNHEDPVAAILGVEPGKILFKGKVVDVERRATEGFLRGRTRFDGMDEYRASSLELNFQNEWIVAWLRRHADRHVARPDLRARFGGGRGGGDGNHPLRPAGDGDRAAAAAGIPYAEGPAACGPTCLRLRHRLQERVCMSLRELTADDIESLAVGAWVLGTGGGSPYLTLLNMRALYKEGRRVQLMPASALDDDDWVGVVASMGAPLVGQERLTDSHTITRAARLMEKHSRRKFDAVMSVEIGGGNGVRPLMVAAHLGVPVVDSDTMGRAYPEAQMSSVAVGGLKPCP